MVADMVREFHETYGVTINHLWSKELAELRITLDTEERDECDQALRSGDLMAIAQELADRIYVLYGTALTFGIDLDKAVAEVHEANMSKLDSDGKPIIRADGKVMKGPNYQAPQMWKCVPLAGRK